MSYEDYLLPRDERLDRVAKAIYRTEREGTVEALLDANPGLAALGPILPRGTVLKVPARPAVVSTGTVRPWE